MGVIDPSSKVEELAKAFRLHQRDLERAAYRLERKRQFVEKAYLNRCSTAPALDHLGCAKDAAKVFDYIESINE